MPGGEGAGHAWAQEPAASAAAAPAATDRTQGPPGRRFIDLWLTRDQQGRRAFDRGDFKAAQRLFDDPMWRGVAAYRAGDYAAARESFARVDAPESEFNQGDALAREGRYEDAQARFEQALQRHPDWPQAQANLKLMRALIAQKKKKDDDEEEQSPDLKPDKVVFDKEKGKGQRELVRGGEQSAEAWMRNIQTSPTQLLARKFELQTQQAEESKAPEGKP